MSREVSRAYTIPAWLETYDGELIILFELNNGKSADNAWMEQKFLRLSESELLDKIWFIDVARASGRRAIKALCAYV